MRNESIGNSFRGHDDGWGDERVFGFFFFFSFFSPESNKTRRAHTFGCSVSFTLSATLTPILVVVWLVFVPPRGIVPRNAALSSRHGVVVFHTVAVRVPHSRPVAGIKINADVKFVINFESHLTS